MRILRLSLTCCFAAILLLAATATFAFEEKTITLGDNTTLTLDKAIGLAYQYNLDIRNSMTDRDISYYKVREARSQGGFTANLTGNYIRTIGGSDISLPLAMYDPTMLSTVGATPTIFSTFDTVTHTASASTTVLVGANPTLQTIDLLAKEQKGASFVLKKPIWTFGKLENNVRLNSAGLESSGLALKRTKLDVALKVRQSFYQYLLAQEFLSVSNDTVKQSQAHYDAAKARFEAGASPKFDVIRAEVDSASANESVAKAQKGVELARMALNNTMGIKVNAPTVIIAPEASEEITMPVDMLIAMAFEKRPEIKQVKLGQYQAELGAKLSRMLPTLGFQGTYTFLNKGSAFGQQNTWQLVLAVDLPVFDSGQAHTKVRQAQETRLKLEQTEAQLRDGINLQVNEAYLSMLEAKARMETSGAIENSAKEAVRMARAGYTEGVTPYLDLLDAEHGLSGASLNRAQARFDYEIAKARLLDAVGVESASDLNDKKK